ncbi:cryptochrome/photolyase family protein [Leucobacter sp. HY1910]
MAPGAAGSEAVGPDSVVSLVWFRDDLRVRDHEALTAAFAAEGSVIGVFVLDEESPGVRALGGASKWWLHHSIESLAASLAALGVPLVLRRGPAAQVVPQVAAQTGATAVFWNRRYGGAERRVDAQAEAAIAAAGVAAHTFAGSLLHEPGEILTDTGTPYRVYSAFWRQVLRRPAPRQPLPAPLPASTATGSGSGSAPALAPAVVSDPLSEWELLPTRPDWAGGLCDRWQPGERAAQSRLAEFLRDDIAEYDEARDALANEGTSSLSPHLRWGEISSRQVWHAAAQHATNVGGFLSEIAWREFAWHTLFHNPDMGTVSLDARFDPHAWVVRPAAEQAAVVSAWQRGETGFGVVDAGMRELWHTGTMHNRARMIVASLLTKNLGVDWRVGEAWFWDTLVDADQANNPFNWQWVAGCGLDAAPYFRIFNPELQAKKFDPLGLYQSRWAADSLGLPPMADLRTSRIAALARYDRIKHA